MKRNKAVLDDFLNPIEGCKMTCKVILITIFLCYWCRKPPKNQMQKMEKIKIEISEICGRKKKRDFKVYFLVNLKKICACSLTDTVILLHAICHVLVTPVKSVEGPGHYLFIIQVKRRLTVGWLMLKLNTSSLWKLRRINYTLVRLSERIVFEKGAFQSNVSCSEV